MDDCGSVLDVDITYSKKCTFTECPECHRGFCIACQNNWHPGVIKISEDKNETKTALEQAKRNCWSRCPKCGFLVEKQSGCLKMPCRCGNNFCYRCGRTHGRGPDECLGQCHQLSEAQLRSLRKSSDTDT